MAQEEIIFPNNIRTIRLGTGMKMTELARRAKLSLSAVSKIEKGVRRLNQKQLLNICNILGCRLSEIFIKESDEVADKWQSEIKRRLVNNEGHGLKIFGAGLRKIRQKSGKTIAAAARDAGMTLSVYHKIEVGQREIYEAEVEPLAKSFKLSVTKMFDEIANMYKSGDLNKQINKIKERIKSVLIPGSPLSGIDLPANLYGAKLYDNARAKLVPVFGVPGPRGISLRKSDKTMIVAPLTLEGRTDVYAIKPNVRRLNNVLPENCYIFVDAEQTPRIGDMAVFIDTDFTKLDFDEIVSAQIGILRADSHGRQFGQIWGPDEKIANAKTMHRVVMIVME
jgi:transcriptional regulator with XRE-family HTH domain